MLDKEELAMRERYNAKCKHDPKDLSMGGTSIAASGVSS